MAEATQNAHALVLRGEIIPPGLGVVAEALAEAGRIDEAIAAATIEDNVNWRSDLLAHFAKARAAAGRIDEAKQVARHVTERPDRAAALTAVAAAQRDGRIGVEAFPRDLVEVALAHSLDSKTEEAYRHTDMIEMRRRLMTKWGERCGRALDEGNVIGLRAASAFAIPEIRRAD